MSLDIPQNILDRLQTATRCRAILLAGSHGRGEGEELLSREIPANDVDLVLVLDKPLSLWERLQLRGLKQTLPTRLNVWHVDIMRMTIAELSDPSVQMLRYDLKYGSRVLRGDARICDFIPYAPGSVLPANEVENLLINRLVTLAEGHPEGRTLSTERHRSARQISKCLYATVDAALVQHGRYRTHYTAKREELHALAGTNARIDALIEQLPWMQQAWNYRLTDELLGTDSLYARWQVTAKLHLEYLLETRSLVDGRSYHSLSDTFPHWRGRAAEHRPAIRRALALAFHLPSKRQTETALARWTLGAISVPGGVEERNRLIADWYRAA